MTRTERAVWIVALCTLVVALFVIFSNAAEAAETLDAQRTEALTFDAHWDQYIRHLFGCPDTGQTTSETCRPAQGTTDYREFAKAREEAKALFRLKD